MLRRFLVAFTAVFAGGLSIEVLGYHPIATLAKDRWAMTPQLSGTLLLFATLFVLAWPRRESIRLFAACCGISVVVGITGVALHFASRALSLADIPTATSWLGNPPPLAPLEFAVVGMLGLVAVAWEGGGTPVPSRTSFAAPVCYGLAALASVVAFILAALTAPATALNAVTAALLIGALGYVIELSANLPARTT